MSVITPLKKNKKTGHLITIPRKEYDELIAFRKSVLAAPQEAILEKQILRLSQEAKKIKARG